MSASVPLSAADPLGPTPRPTVDAASDGRQLVAGCGNLGRPATATPCPSADEVHGVAAWAWAGLTWSLSDVTECDCGCRLLYPHDLHGWWPWELPMVCPDAACRRLAWCDQEGGVETHGQMDPPEHAAVVRSWRLARLEVPLDPIDQLLQVLRSHGPGTGPGIRPARVMAIVTGLAAPADWVEADTAAYLLSLTLRREALAADIAGLLRAYEDAEALALSARQGVELAEDARDVALDRWSRGEGPIDAIDPLGRLAHLFSDYGAELKLSALTQLAHAAALAGLEGVELLEST